MIVFDLKCTYEHTFEGWFQTSADFDDQKARDLIECPRCGSAKVTKAIMAPNVASKGNQKSEAPAKPAQPSISDSRPINVGDAGMIMAGDSEFQAAIAPELPQELQDQMEELFAKVQKHVEDTCTYVGSDFAEEARKGHYGESEERGIYGEASEEDTLELLDEGIEILPMPSKRKADA